MWSIIQSHQFIFLLCSQNREQTLTHLFYYCSTQKLLLLLLLIVHIEYSKVNVKLSDSQIKRLKDAVKDNTGTTLRISLKMFNGNDLPHELLLTRRQKTKLRNAFNNNMSVDIKFSKVQISKIIQSGGFLGSL